MSKEREKLEVPKWFTGQVYESGDTVRNPFSGDSYYLSGPELSMYDFIMGCNYILERGQGHDKMLAEFHKGLTWFRRANPEAYMVLLD
jgi:hypothetical protein